MKKEQAKELLSRYLNENVSPKEQHLVDAFIEEQLLTHTWEATEDEKLAFAQKLRNRLSTQIHQHDGRNNTISKNKPKFRRLWYFSAAATIAVLMLTTIYFFSLRTQSIAERYANDIPPGKNKAILTLSNGQKIDLNNSGNGELAKLNGISIKKAADGLLVFSVLNAEPKRKINFNTIETPFGGQYQINLPDGTKVWLNSGTKLTFPDRFADAKRKVELSGEAYFEVAKDKTHPFLVSSNAQQVEVLGTHFNVNSYSNEPLVRTTLLEGSVKVSNSVSEKIIVPGEQITLKGNRFDVKQIDPSSAIDWKNGEFRFKAEGLESILRKLSRWYQVEFVVEKGVDKLPAFSGSVSRFDQISVVLKMLEETGDIKFYINGKTITVKP
ncbi:FecR family protein [Pedobacter jejuensis]|uniref:FecR family protein n=1 Tax=Pedobacter jejuensis TaxID=1268550 RepID=A0A3N0C162_9SPHI|nr:FecR family protein [Pedobacter jejuensis]RNL55766.1 FecR family protein [Pedobacter jejuensis]